jgi:hypothetical protein
MHEDNPPKCEPVCPAHAIMENALTGNLWSRQIDSRDELVSLNAGKKEGQRAKGL